jgi:hypothetical protein
MEEQTIGGNLSNFSCFSERTDLRGKKFVLKLCVVNMAQIISSASSFFVVI